MRAELDVAQSSLRDLDAVKAELEKANTALATLQKEKAIAISQRDSVNRANAELRDSLKKAEEKLRVAESAKAEAEEAAKKSEKDIVDRWLDSEAGEEYQNNLRVNGAAEGHGMFELYYTNKMKLAISRTHPKLWKEIKAQFEEIEDEEVEGQVIKSPSSGSSSSSSSDDGDDGDQGADQVEGDDEEIIIM